MSIESTHERHLVKCCAISEFSVCCFLSFYTSFLWKIHLPSGRIQSNLGKFSQNIFFRSIVKSIADQSLPLRSNFLLLVQAVWFGSLVGELRSHMSCSMAKRFKKKKKVLLVKIYTHNTHIHLGKTDLKISIHIYHSSWINSQIL